jgi:tetratricopeptide (TPR) repeat protein
MVRAKIHIPWFNSQYTLDKETRQVQPGTRLGPYEVVAQIGAGGMGEVYRARDTRLDRDVAIKVLPAEFAADPERLRRFEQEARAVAALSHPNILDVHDVGTHEGSPYLVTELLEGESLRDRLRGGGLTVRKAVETAVQIAQGLAAAHEKGIVHRDLKPGNVFVTKGGTVKILDFGIAKLVAPRSLGAPAQATTVVEATEAGTTLGTVGYMSPEQVRGQSVDHRTDIFSFGCVLYEMLLGRSPFRRDTAADTASAILHQDPAPLVGTGQVVAPALQEIVNRCLEKQPEGRFSSAHDLALALRAYSSGSETPATAKVPARQRSLLLVGGILAVAAVVAALAIWRPWRAASAPVVSGPGHLPSILALPCKVYGAPEVAFLTDAVPGTISTLLAQVDGLDTKVPPTSLEVDKLKGDVAKIAGAFQVESLVLTTLTANGDRLVLNAQLVEASSRRVRWGKQYEGLRRDFNELARQAAEGVRQAVSPVSAPVPTAARSGEAELAFREGKYFLNNYKNRLQQADFDLALKAFTMALEKDPSFARAAGEIARLYFARYQTVAEGEKDQELRRIESWARRAIDLDPHCGEAWEALGWVQAYALNIEMCVEYSLKAARYAPRDAGTHVALSTALQGPGSEFCALVTAQHARELDPLETQAAYLVALRLFNLGKPREALLAIDQGLALEPDSTLPLPLKSLILTKLGRFAEAADTLQHSEPLPTQVDLHEEWYRARLALALAENDAATVTSLEGPLFQLVSGERGGVCVPCYLLKASYAIAPRLAHVGRKDDALKILLRAVETGFAPSYDWLLLEPDIQSLRGDPRFGKVLVGSRDGAAIIARVLGRARTRGELPAYLNQPLDELQRLLNEKGGTI